MSKLPIQMVDLKGQYKKIETEVLAAIHDVMESSAFINGPQVARFASELAKYTNSGYVVPCGNGTDALQIALMGLNLKPGDEVIVPSFTYIATAEVISLLGLKPVFIDVNPDTFTLDVSQLESVCTSKTKVIMVVHLFGQCADMEAIMAFAERQNLAVIEDNAQALGAVYTFSDGNEKQAGTMGEIGSTSFFPTKGLATYGDGGAMFAQDENMAVRLKQIASHGQKKKYYHEILGVNSRLDTLHAAILSVKLKYLPVYEKKRQDVARYYDENLNGISGMEIPARNPNSTHVYHQYTLKILNSRRDEFRTYLSEKGIPSMVYYPLPQHLQKSCAEYGYQQGDFPVSETLSEQVCSIPVHTELTLEEMKYICEQIKMFFK